MIESIFSDEEFVSKAIKIAAFEGIPDLISANTDEKLKPAVLKISQAFNYNDFSLILENSDVSIEKNLIDSFMKNIQLLVQKTWVKKNDEEFKINTIYRINNLCDKLLNSKDISIYKTVFDECFSILKAIVELLFGDSVNTDNFLEYTIRIDPEFGFFWYFIDNISKIKDISDKKAKYSILLAISFLTVF